MRNLLFTLLFLLMVGAVNAQHNPDSTHNHPPEITLYRTMIKPVSGEKFTGILYDLTDTTLVYFANDLPTVQRVKLGFIPDLKTIRLTDIRRVAIKRRGHFWIATGIGIGVAGVLHLLASSTGMPSLGTAIFKEYARYLLIPGAILLGVVSGLLPGAAVWLSGSPFGSPFGSPRYASKVHDRLYKYTVASQQ